MSARAPATRATVKLAAPGALPRNANTLAYVFGSALAEAAAPLRAVFLEQLLEVGGDSPLRDLSSLEARASVAYADRRHRNVDNIEPVLRAALQGALEDAGWRARKVELRVQLRGSAARPGTTVELGNVA